MRGLSGTSSAVDVLVFVRVFRDEKNELKEFWDDAGGIERAGLPRRSEARAYEMGDERRRCLLRRGGVGRGGWLVPDI